VNRSKDEIPGAVNKEELAEMLIQKEDFQLIFQVRLT